MSASFRCDGRLFCSPGPAAANALSPKVLYVRVTTHVQLTVERSRHLADKYETRDKHDRIPLGWAGDSAQTR